MRKKDVFILADVFNVAPFDTVLTSRANRVAENIGKSANEKQWALDFATRVVNDIYTVFLNAYTSKKYAVALEFVKEDTTKAGGSGYVIQGLYALATAFFKRYFKRETVLAWKYLDGVYEVGESGTFSSSSETNTTGTSENSATGTAKQRFNNGVTSASTGTATSNENTETGTGLTTGKTTQTSKQGFAHEYAGKPDELANANMQGAGVLQKVVNAFSQLLIPVDELQDGELIDVNDIEP